MNTPNPRRAKSAAEGSFSIQMLVHVSALLMMFFLIVAIIALVFGSMPEVSIGIITSIWLYTKV